MCFIFYTTFIPKNVIFFFFSFHYMVVETKNLHFVYNNLRSMYYVLWVPWRLVHPRLVPVTVQPTRLVLVTGGLLNCSTHIYLVSVLFSPRIFRPPLGEGELIVTCVSWSNPLWQLVYPPCLVELTRNVTTYLGVWTFSPSDSWTCTFPCFLGHFP